MADYSFIAQGVNPLEQVGKIATVQGQVNTNRLFQGRQAAGDALQQSVDPQTGEPDFNRAAALVSRNKLIAPYAMEALSNLQAMHGQQIANAGSQRTIQQAKGDLVRTAIGSIGPTATRHDVLGALNILSSTGQIDKDFAAGIAGSLPGDDTQIGSWAQNNFQLPAMGADASLKATSPAPTAINTGDKVDLVRLPNIGSPTAVGSVDLHLSPEAKAARIPTVTPGGQPQSVPQSALVTPTGDPRAGGIAGPHGEVATGLAPGEAESIGSPKIAQAGQAAELGKVYEGSTPRAAQLKELLAAQGDFRSGPGAAKWSGIVSEFNRVLGTNLAGDQVAAQQTFGKIAEQVAEAQRGAMGSNATNAQTEAARIASPNTTYSPEANRRVIGMLLGNEDYIQTKQRAWQAFQQHGGKPSQYNAFVQQFNTHFDPRYFQEQYMTTAQKSEMRKSMSAAEQKKYDAAKALALSLDFGQ